MREGCSCERGVSERVWGAVFGQGAVHGNGGTAEACIGETLDRRVASKVPLRAQGRRVAFDAQPVRFFFEARRVVSEGAELLVGVAVVAVPRYKSCLCL